MKKFYLFFEAYVFMTSKYLDGLNGFCVFNEF